jgi:hypothetical protein
MHRIRIGEKRQTVVGRAMSQPSPKMNEVRRTALPDTFDGIRFEVGRMAKYVQEARGDVVVIDCARLAAAQWGKMVEEMSAREGNPVSAHGSKAIALEGIDLWCRQNFCYQNDGTNVEVIQTPRRMANMTRVPKDILRHFIEPFYRAFEASDPAFYRHSYEPRPVYVGDCDESAIMVCSMAAALDITPVSFRFGGGGGTLHHVWARVFADGEWYDSDVTEPQFKLGETSRFDHYESYEIPL